MFKKDKLSSLSQVRSIDMHIRKGHNGLILKMILSRNTLSDCNVVVIVIIIIIM